MAWRDGSTSSPSDPTELVAGRAESRDRLTTPIVRPRGSQEGPVEGSDLNPQTSNRFPHSVLSLSAGRFWRTDTRHSALDAEVVRYWCRCLRAAAQRMIKRPM